MTHGWRRLTWAAAGLVGLPVIAVAVMLTGADTDAGRRLAERLVATLTGGQVVVSGMSGHFPDRLGIAHIELADTGGPWATVDDLRLDWSPRQLAAKIALVDRLAARRVSLLRLPASSGEPDGKPAALPIQVRVRDFSVERVDVAAPVAGVSASFSLQGAFRLASLDRGEAMLAVRRLDAPGTYRFDGALASGHIDAHLTANEPAQGMLAALADLPDIGPLSFDAVMKGPLSAAQSRLALAAGPLTAAADGEIDLDGETGDLVVTASAPAMTLRPDLSWHSATLTAHLSGALERPNADGRLTIDHLLLADAAVDLASVGARSNGGTTNLRATLAGVRLPGPSPDLLGSAPVALTADIAQHGSPIAFTVFHPLVAADGRADFANGIRGTMTVSLPDLTPLARAAGMSVAGRATLTATIGRHGEDTAFSVAGTTAIAKGPVPLPALLGGEAKFVVDGSLHGQDIAVDRAAVTGKRLQVSAAGTDIGNRLDVRWSAALADLSALAPAVSGKLAAQGRLEGALADLALTAQAKGEAAGAGVKAKSIEISLAADGLPQAARAQITARGRVADAPLQLAATLRQGRDGRTDVSIGRISWKSAEARGALSLIRGEEPQGSIDATVGDLADFQPVIGAVLKGRIDAKIDVSRRGSRSVARIRLDGRQLVVSNSRAARLSLEGSIADPTGRPNAALRLTGEGVAAAGTTGTVRMTADGPGDALRLSADVEAGGARLSAAAVMDLARRQAIVEALQVKVPGETVRLTQPARISFADGVAVDHLHLGTPKAAVDIAGRLSPTLDLRADGTIDLAVLDSVLAANGRSVRGELAMNLGAAGSTAAPRLSGTAKLTNGEVQDYVAGLHLSGITADLRADGDSLEISRLTAHAGPGSIDAAGSLGILAAGLPVDLAVTARNAVPLNSDLLTADLDADLSLRGQAAARLELTGSVRVKRATINIPETFPSTVAVLEVRRPGQSAPRPQGAPALAIGLALTLDAPEQVFVRGHGLDAEMGGEISIGGSGADPRFIGGLALRHGTIDLAGQSLNFTKGTVGFNGSGLEGKIDPTLALTAETTSAGVTATLTVTGYADTPKIALSSAPELPQDEILAHLLFGQGMKQLSPLQIAQLAQGLASLTGVGGGFDPLAAARKELGLDRLSPEAGAGGTGAGVEAGKYVAKGVYVGAKQQSAGPTQARVQIDLTPHLKLDTTLGDGGNSKAVGANPQNDPGSGIGLTYGIDY